MKLYPGSMYYTDLSLAYGIYVRNTNKFPKYISLGRSIYNNLIELVKNRGEVESVIINNSTRFMYKDLKMTCTNLEIMTNFQYKQTPIYLNSVIAREAIRFIAKEYLLPTERQYNI